MKELEFLDYCNWSIRYNYCAILPITTPILLDLLKIARLMA